MGKNGTSFEQVETFKKTLHILLLAQDLAQHLILSYLENSSTKSCTSRNVGQDTKKLNTAQAATMVFFLCCYLCESCRTSRTFMPD